jgi:hypothetical protein
MKTMSENRLLGGIYGTGGGGGEEGEDVEEKKNCIMGLIICTLFI